MHGVAEASLSWVDYVIAGMMLMVFGNGVPESREKAPVDNRGFRVFGSANGSGPFDFAQGKLSAPIRFTRLGRRWL